jgi:hypothetical protein
LVSHIEGRERRLTNFESRVLRKVFGPKREEVTGDWRRLHSEGLHDLYWSPNIVRCDQIKEDEMGGACSMYWGGGELHAGF